VAGSFSNDYLDHSYHHASDTFSDHKIKFISRYRIELDYTNNYSHSYLNIDTNTDGIDDSDTGVSCIIAHIPEVFYDEQDRVDQLLFTDQEFTVQFFKAAMRMNHLKQLLIA
jgi:hypothetical protein